MSINLDNINLTDLVKAITNQQNEHAKDEPILQLPKQSDLHVTAGEQRIGIPETTSVPKAIRTLTEYQEGQETDVRVVRKIVGRLEDVQVAVKRVAEATWGTSGKGNLQFSFFGTQPPMMIDVTVGVNSDGSDITEKVYGSEFDLAPLEASVSFGDWEHEEFGTCAYISIVTKKKNERAVTAFLQAVEQYLKTNSIYKGKVLEFRAKQNGGYNLVHRNVKVNPHIVYNDDVQEKLTRGVFWGIKYADKYKMAGMADTFNALLYGPYGTGKTECGIMAAEAATESGWTTVFFTPSEKDGIKDLEAAYNLANLYGPSLLVVEDIDRYFTESDNPKAAAAISNLLDGMNSKSGKVSILMTTNHFNKLPEVATRNGRMDFMIEIGWLDRKAMEQMFYNILGNELEDDVDFDAIYEIVKDTGPSFIRGTFDLARKYAIGDNDGELYGRLSTGALRTAAAQMKENSDLHRSRQEPTPEERYVATLRDLAKITTQLDLAPKAQLSDALVTEFGRVAWKTDEVHEHLIG